MLGERISAILLTACLAVSSRLQNRKHSRFPNKSIKNIRHSGTVRGTENGNLRLQKESILGLG